MYGFVITTHHNNYDLINKCLTLLFENTTIENSYYVLYVNETTCDKVLNIKDQFKLNEVIYIDDQIKNKGLTGTWNQGINLCIENNCDVITLLGHDTYVNKDIIYLLQAGKKANDNKELKYFGPLFKNYPGKDDELWQDEIYYKCTHNKNFLIGSILTLPIYTLKKNILPNNKYFNENYPFGYNDIEYYLRLKSINGSGIIIDKCIIDHKYKRTWLNVNLVDKYKKDNNLYVAIKDIFDWKKYIMLNPDLINYNNEILATKHYLTIGKFQNRRIN